jgi:hypothetical protein
MMQQNIDERANNNYLYVAEAVKKVCDIDLVHEMLFMLHASIQNDWSEFENFSKLRQFASAANVLHGMKGTIPIFSDRKTEEIMQKTESLLRTSSSESDIKSSTDDLRFQMQGFMYELDLWVKAQQKITI